MQKRGVVHKNLGIKDAPAVSFIFFLHILQQSREDPWIRPDCFIEGSKVKAVHLFYASSFWDFNLKSEEVLKWELTFNFYHQEPNRAHFSILHHH